MIEIPFPWLCLDIETANPDDSIIEREIANWKPTGNVKDPAKIEAQRAEAETKIREKAGLLNAAPICSIAIHSCMECKVFHTLKVGEVGIVNVAAPDERSMLMMLRQYLDTYCGEPTVLVGHNIKKFDLPKLRLRYAVHRLRLPEILAPTTEIPVDDTMILFARYFCVGERQFVSLGEMTDELGISNGGKILNGKQIPQMVEAGQHTEIVLYNAADAMLTTQAWQILTSQVGA